VLDLCETGIHEAVVAWQTLPIVHYYFRKGHTSQESWDMLRDLLVFMDVPNVGKAEVTRTWGYGMADFEAALQSSCAEAARADASITRNTTDFASSPVAACTPEDFLAKFHPVPPTTPQP